jgi:hypothetical protein
MRIAVDRGPERVFRYLLREAAIDIERDRVELSRLRLITPAFPLVSLPGGHLRRGKWMGSGPMCCEYSRGTRRSIGRRSRWMPLKR